MWSFTVITGREGKREPDRKRNVYRFSSTWRMREAPISVLSAADNVAEKTPNMISSGT
jgi:hypothetical protein